MMSARSLHIQSFLWTHPKDKIINMVNSKKDSQRDHPSLNDFSSVLTLNTERFLMWTLHRAPV